MIGASANFTLFSRRLSWLSQEPAAATVQFQSFGISGSSAAALRNFTLSSGNSLAP